MKTYHQQLLQGSMTDCCIRTEMVLWREFLDIGPKLEFNSGFDIKPTNDGFRQQMTYRVSKRGLPVLSVNLTEQYKYDGHVQDPEVSVELGDRSGENAYENLTALFEQFSIKNRKY